MVSIGFKRVVVAAGLLIASSLSAFALSIPSAEDQEVLVKTTLMTFNDANLTGNYTVLHAKAAKPFRDQFSPDKFKEIFKGFVDNHVDISRAVAKPLKGNEAKLDDDMLILQGSIDLTSDYHAAYVLKYIQSDGEWKIIGLDVKT